MKLVGELEHREMDLDDVPEAVAKNFLDSDVWKERLRRSLLYPGTQDIDDALPLPISEFCVEKYREYAPSNMGKLGPRVASRLSRNACLSPSAVVTSMIYLKRLKMNNPEYLQRVPSSELFIVSMMVASKYLFDDGTDDECYNDEWADCMGFDLHRLGELEVEFLNALDWKCHVSVDQFSTVLKQLEVELALNQQSKSGLFTYNTARNLDIMVAMIDTMKLVSKLFMLSAVTLLGFTSALDSIGKNCLDENTDLNTEKWDTNRLPVNETSQTGVEAPENSRVPVLISDIDEVIDSITDDRLTDQMDANETILRENDFAQSISKITSPAVSNSRCFSSVCAPVTENQRLLVSVII